MEDKNSVEVLAEKVLTLLIDSKIKIGLLPCEAMKKLCMWEKFYSGNHSHSLLARNLGTKTNISLLDD